MQTELETTGARETSETGAEEVADTGTGETSETEAEEVAETAAKGETSDTGPITHKGTCLYISGTDAFDYYIAKVIINKCCLLYFRKET